MAMVLGGKHHTGPLAERGRPAPDVDGDVVHLAFEHAHELALRMRPLVMQAAQHAARRARNVRLDEMPVDACFPVLRVVEALVEETTGVAEHLRFDHDATGEGGFDELHPT